MADVVGTVSAAVALLETGGKVVIAMYRFKNDVNSATEDLEALLEQVERTQGKWDGIKTVYQEAQGQAEQLSGNEWFRKIAAEMKSNIEGGTLSHVITDCNSAYHELTKLLKLDLSVDVVPGPQLQSSIASQALQPTNSQAPQPLATNTQPQPSNASPQRPRTSLWRLMMRPRKWKPYYLWFRRRRKVMALLESFRQYADTVEAELQKYRG